MNIKAVFLLCVLLLVTHVKVAAADGGSGQGNNAKISSSSIASFSDDYCCTYNKSEGCCLYGDCCGTTCCGKDDQCFFDKCINTGGMSRTWTIVVAVIVLLAVIIIIVMLIWCCCTCCRRCCGSKNKPKKYSAKEHDSHSTTVATTVATTTKSSASTAVELEEGKVVDPPAEVEEKTEEELEAEKKQKEWKKKFKKLTKPITEILDIYVMNRVSLEDATEMMIFVVIKYYMDIPQGDQDAISMYTKAGSEALENLYAKFHKLVPDKEKNAFIGNIFGNLAEKRTEIEKACEGDFTSALGSASKAIGVAAGLVNKTVLTQDNAIMIVSAMLSTVLKTKKITENSSQDQKAFEDWFDSLKLYLPKAHADYIKASSWENVFELLEE